MKNSKTTSLLILVMLAVLGMTVLGAFRNQSQNNSASANQNDQKKDNLKKAAEDFYTMTDYAAPEPTEPRRRALRRARAKRYNMPAQKGVDPKHFMITEERDSAFGTPSSHAPIEPALPVVQSDAVVIGEVTNAEAFLTEDKTAVFSEFTVKVTDVLKNNSVAPFAWGDSIDAIRGGGAVRLPSGKVIRQGLHGRPFPRIGRKYVFFLKYESEGRGFAILTAYELRDGRVFPLDGLEWDGRITPQYAPYQKYKGVDEATFRSEVLAGIANGSQGGR
jgi:hypothetical protein